MNGFHHLRARARKSKGLEVFPSNTALKRFLDYIMYGVGMVAPLALLPQILQLYRTESATGLSLLTWVLLTCVNGLWSLYGFVHKDRQLFLATSLMVLFHSIIVVGILLYS